MKLSNNKILITGGASGIGLGLTELFLANNNEVIICGRRQTKLDETKKKFPQLITFQCDLGKESERINLFNWIQSEHPDTEIIINNAGIQHWMDITDNHYYPKALEEITTNIIAPVHLITLFSKHPGIKTIINITSGLALSPLVKVPVYSATKAFLRSYTQSLREQLKQKSIEVIEILPPKLNTDLGGVGIHDDAPSVEGFIQAIYDQLKRGKTEIGYGLSQSLLDKNTASTKEHFRRLNQIKL